MVGFHLDRSKMQSRVITFLTALLACGVGMASTAAKETTKSPPDAATVANEWEDFTALGVEIRPGTKHKLSSMPLSDFVGMRMAVPVWIARGRQQGKTLAITAGIHGDELNGVEIARRVFAETDSEQLSGTLVVLPLLNRHGFLAGTRYMSDRRDLNRAFPGDPARGRAHRLAHRVGNSHQSAADPHEPQESGRLRPRPQLRRWRRAQRRWS
jgi:hypothetical protein